MTKKYLNKLKFEHEQNCINVIWTPCMSASIVNTQGVPIGAKGSTVRTSQLAYQTLFAR